jgi:glycosyltransferase involved in cell wall biosynthesis
MLIAFTHRGKAFLPEIGAYRQFFGRYGIDTVDVHPDELFSLKPDVEWRFMGTHSHRHDEGLLIHEYASASLPPLPYIKDRVKKKFNAKPDYRLFLNNYVKDRFHFRDETPFGYRDMGIDPGLLSLPAEDKLYDFIYVGSVSPDMRPEKLLSCFERSSLRNKSLLILSKDYDTLRNLYRHAGNIIFKGPVTQQEVYRYIRQSSFALNYKPDIAPHNRQTSTKLLEYAACRTPIITTDFAWMRDFERQYGGKYFYLDKDMSNLSWERVNGFQYTFPDLDEWIWEKQIRRSGVLEFLGSRLGWGF